ncbi:hypothetical protein [Acidovorax sp. sic0104]|uniref:hypothetical protein n=1 Tax=Acidovorax sp. sic0104 TaxID=2854784 RepID=UPI001C4607D9|nr:hypothetical protein [Acidovorax sp. sic0104]MBV7542017.1 hypothetical protein [Acidovorax sp. sic0104]
MYTLLPYLHIDIAARHDRGEHSIANDIEVCDRFGLEVSGLSGNLWRARCYLRGFLSA